MVSRKNWYTLTLLLIILLAAVPRLLTYDRYLPLLDYPDESNMFLLSISMRPDEVPLAADYGASYVGEWLAGYPPLYPQLGVWVGRLQEMLTDQFLFPGDYIGMMRLLSVGVNLLTVAVLYALGYSLLNADDRNWRVLAGIVTALPYAVAPPIVDLSNLAIPDALVPLGCALALLGAVRAIQQERPAWLIVGLIGAIAAVYLKYSQIMGLWAVGYGALILLRRRGLRRSLPWLLVLAVIAGISAAYLIWGYGALGLENREAANFRETGFVNMLSLSRNIDNLHATLTTWGGTLPFLVVVLPGVLVALHQRHTNIGHTLALILPFTALNIALTSSIVLVDPQFGGYGRLRFIFPSVVALSGLYAVAWVALGRVLLRRAGRFVMVLGVGGALVGFTYPADAGNAALIRTYAATDTNLLLWRYTDTNLPPTGAILTPRDSRVHNVWNRPYSGYDGATPFAWLYHDQPYTIDPQQAFDDGVHYFIYTEADQVVRLDTPTMYDWRDSLYKLKSIRPDGVTTVGEWTHIFRLMPPKYALQAHFGAHITLVGYDLSISDETLHFRPYWSASGGTPDANYSLAVQLYPLGQPEAVIAQWDGAPVNPIRLPTTWDDPDERLMGAQVELPLPPEFNDLVLGVILYNFETGERLPTPDGDNFQILLQ